MLNSQTDCRHSVLTRTASRIRLNSQQTEYDFGRKSALPKELKQAEDLHDIFYGSPEVKTKSATKCRNSMLPTLMSPKKCKTKTKGVISFSPRFTFCVVSLFPSRMSIYLFMKMNGQKQ